MEQTGQEGGLGLEQRKKEVSATDVFLRDLCGIQVEVPSRRLETQAWNTGESSGQDKDRSWESSEHKRHRSYGSRWDCQSKLQRRNRKQKLPLFLPTSKTKAETAAFLSRVWVTMRNEVQRGPMQKRAKQLSLQGLCVESLSQVSTWANMLFRRRQWKAMGESRQVDQREG